LLFLQEQIKVIIIIQAILQQGLGATFENLSAYELAWCRVIVELPHHRVV
jgi:hypothetical protein